MTDTELAELVAAVSRPTTLEVIADAKTRDDVVWEYANCIIAEDDGYAQDWPAIKAAIVAKWSPNALVYIKTQAWRRVKEYNAA